MEKVNLTGWQSWTACGKEKTLLSRIRYFSPFGMDNSECTIDKPQNQKPIRGWSSWPYFGRNVSQSDIFEIADWMYENTNTLKLDYLVIDDGWTQWGDWDSCDTNKFPQMMQEVAKYIKSKNIKPGIWVSPFLIGPKSSVYKKHPEWIVRNKTRQPINGLKNFFFDKLIPRKKYILDLEIKEAYDYIIKCLESIIKVWGYELIKLDFLYAGHYNTKYTSSDKPDKMLSKLLSDIRKINKNVKIIGCGCPLSPAAGKVNAIRISEDIIIPELKNIFPINKFMHERRLNHLSNNLKARLNTKKIWLIDPDIFVCDKAFGLTEKSIMDFQKNIKLANGVYFLGDYLPRLSKSSIEKYIKPLLT